MSICTCPRLSTEQWEKMFRNTAGDPDWNLVKLKDMALAGNSLESITESFPFRNDQCRRSHRCCGQCTCVCRNRCIQDSFNRLYMWRKLVETTPESQQHLIPLGIRMIVKQQFTNAADLSWSVGEILSRARNTQVSQYMEEHHLARYSNPYKVDYSPTYAMDSSTGKRLVNVETGELKILEWPESGLCPYCTPTTTVDRRYGRRSEY